MGDNGIVAAAIGTAKIFFDEKLWIEGWRIAQQQFMECSRQSADLGPIHIGTFLLGENDRQFGFELLNGHARELVRKF